MMENYREKHHIQVSKFKNRHTNIYFFIIGIALIMVWRGIWGVLDLYLFPDNALLSYLVSAGLGLGILYFNDFSLSELSSH